MPHKRNGAHTAFIDPLAENPGFTLRMRRIPDSEFNR